eukprot:CAMPEP_0181369736 /NCGR_PEP_ID=MMETSP1106-20121128/12972_1 /TAXON_ID=81844 /ORGANISM="Mantoniella antarctica, Strain SL-175" /LENGTH=76 /DNA_ID=CAMNT_0023486323 /DNA_START=411 /DNA_END=641 /DNA_ORIENTATION=-
MPPKLPFFGTSITSPPLPSTLLHTKCLGLVGDFETTTSPRTMALVITDTCSNNSTSPALLNVGSMLGPKHMVNSMP